MAYYLVVINVIYSRCYSWYTIFCFPDVTHGILLGCHQCHSSQMLTYLTTAVLCISSGAWAAENVKGYCPKVATLNNFNMTKVRIS